MAGEQVVIQDARPFYESETGVRTGGWNAFFDYPPRHPDGTRHSKGVFRLRSATVRTIGDRVELLFDGLRTRICRWLFLGERGYWCAGVSLASLTHREREAIFVPR